MKKNNIILIGMPGAGKSTIGIVLAKVLGYHFIDSDLLIQEREKRLLCEIIQKEGLDRFKRIEEDVNESINVEDSIIATGGSVIYGPAAMEHLKSIGTIIYLKLSYESVGYRLGNLKARGVALKDGQSLLDLYKERCPLYEKYADITINCEKMEIKDTISIIVEKLKTIRE